MTTLLIGATGTIGREVASQLVASGRPVRALTRNASRAQRVLGPDVDVIVGDITNPNDIAAAVDGVDAVILTHGGDSDPQRIYYGAVKALVTALSDESGKIPIALMSSINVTRGAGAYATLMNWKRRGERLLRASGAPLTVIRPGWFGRANPGDGPVLRQGDAIEYGPVAVEHVAQALIAGLDIPGYTVELFSQADAPQDDWASAFGAMRRDGGRSFDGAGDESTLPEEYEPKEVRDDLTWARSLHP